MHILGHLHPGDHPRCDGRVISSSGVAYHHNLLKVGGGGGKQHKGEQLLCCAVGSIIATCNYLQPRRGGHLLQVWHTSQLQREHARGC